MQQIIYGHGQQIVFFGEFIKCFLLMIFCSTIFLHFAMKIYSKLTAQKDHQMPFVQLHPLHPMDLPFARLNPLEKLSPIVPPTDPTVIALLEKLGDRMTNLEKLSPIVPATDLNLIKQLEERIAKLEMPPYQIVQMPHDEIPIVQIPHDESPKTHPLAIVLEKIENVRVAAEALRKMDESQNCPNSFAPSFGKDESQNCPNSFAPSFGKDESPK
jgi:hypothetical protein